MPINEISADARVLAEVLGKAPIGGTIRYTELSEAISRDVRRSRHLIYTAMRLLLRERGIAFSQVVGVGYRRLDAREVHKVGAATRAHIRRSARRARKAVSIVQSKANDLSPAEQRQASAEISSLSLIEHIARDKFASSMAGETGEPLPVAASGKLFLEKIGGL